jgi:predicted CXXCH cytochrome family protein
VHRKVGCCECHARSGDRCEGPVRCDECHADAARTFRASVHGAGPGAPRCPDCHGGHEILAATDPASLTHRRRLPLTCRKCHQKPATAEYFGDAHGHALLVTGLVAAPGCGDCHGPSHQLGRVAERAAPTSRQLVPQTCGRCHPSILREFQASAHGQAFGRGDARAPTCTDCHGAHRALKPNAAFLRETNEVCAKCHADRARQYQATYHGKAHGFGVTRVATCSDCHQAHSIWPSSDPRSSLAPTRRAETCRKCHQGATDRFATIYAHADPTDAKAYPGLYRAEQAMMGLLWGLLGLVGLHSVLWVVRAAREAARDPAPFWEERRRRRALGARTFLRFRAIDRFCHALLLVGFLVLVATGMPLKFHEAAWAKLVFAALGGAKVAGALHRIGAVATVSAVLLHLGSLWPLRTKFTGPDSLLPNRQDLRDGWAYLRWFVRGGARPGLDRFAYWEKLDYLAVATCVAVMALTGLAVWFPQATTAFLPGWVVNLSQLLHSDEALIVAALVLVAHLFNVAFRPDRFPLDPVMFSGRVSEDELRFERPRLHARLGAGGALHEAQDDWQDWKPIVSFLGLVALLVGLTLAVGIFWGLGSILFG